MERIDMNRIHFALLLGLMFSIQSVHAQSRAESAVRSRVEALRRAMVDADAAALDELVSEDLSYGHSNAVVEDKKRFSEKLITGESDFLTMELSELTVKISGKTALVRCRLDGKTSDGGKPGQAKLHVLMVWQQKGGTWKLLARQATKLL
jgi:ketosteroid isomerase-like protein